MRDTHDRHRVDDGFPSLKHLRLFRVSDLGMRPRELEFKTTEYQDRIFTVEAFPAIFPASRFIWM